MDYVPILDHFSQRPKSQLRRNAWVKVVEIRDAFSLTTWLLLGAVLQGLLCLLLPYKNIALVAPAAFVLLFRSVLALLQSAGILKNPYMDDVFVGRAVPVFADEKGVRGGTGEEQICAILLASRSNSPMGVFTYGVDELDTRFNEMIAELDANAKARGFLGASNWLSTERSSCNESMSILYFESPQKMQEFAHGKLHTTAMEWWHQNLERLSNVGIMHEVLYAPKGHWEGVYGNYHPTGIGATTKQAEIVNDKGATEKVWINPLVMGKDNLKYSGARMGPSPFNMKTKWNALEKMEKFAIPGY